MCVPHILIFCHRQLALRAARFIVATQLSARSNHDTAKANLFLFSPQGLDLFSMPGIPQSGELGRALRLLTSQICRFTDVSFEIVELPWAGLVAHDFPMTTSQCLLLTQEERRVGKSVQDV